VPEFSSLHDVINVIDVPETRDGLILRILINADIEEAIALFSEPISGNVKISETTDLKEWKPSDQWKWRYKMAEQIASQVKPGMYGIKGIYIFGSTKNANAGPASDIDILVHIDHYNKDIEGFKIWLDGWSKCLSEINFIRTGYKTNGLLDVHFVTDDDIEKKTSWAVKINAVTDAAKPLLMEGQS
jgi:hypothetical protein